jgi:hypothetical protein
MMMTAFWDIALMMEAVSISETLGCFNETTRRNIPKGFHLHQNIFFAFFHVSLALLVFIFAD